jgi:hypothetical protein
MPRLPVRAVHGILAVDVAIVRVAISDVVNPAEIRGAIAR